MIRKFLNWVRERRQWRRTARELLEEEAKNQISLGFDNIFSKFGNERIDELRSKKNSQFEISTKIQIISKHSIRVFLSCSPYDARPLDWIFAESLHYEIDNKGNITF